MAIGLSSVPGYKAARSSLLSPGAHSYVLGLRDALAVGGVRPQEPRGFFVSSSFDLAQDVSSRFGRRLRALRLERNLTQLEMARRFGIDRSFISDVERGKKAISLPLLEVIALGMQMNLAELFSDV